MQNLQQKYITKRQGNCLENMQESIVLEGIKEALWESKSWKTINCI